MVPREPFRLDIAEIYAVSFSPTNGMALQQLFCIEDVSSGYCFVDIQLLTLSALHHHYPMQYPLLCLCVGVV